MPTNTFNAWRGEPRRTKRKQHRRPSVMLDGVQVYLLHRLGDVRWAGVDGGGMVFFVDVPELIGDLL